jgi:hypothetical protein
MSEFLTSSQVEGSFLDNIYKVREHEKKFIHTQISIQMIELYDDEIVDLLDFERANRKISIK